MPEDITPQNDFSSTADQEDISAVRKRMRGFFARLTPTQQEAVLAYDGDDTVGDPLAFEEGRPMTGFLATLSPEERAVALQGFDNPEDERLGNPDDVEKAIRQMEKDAEASMTDTLTPQFNRVVVTFDPSLVPPAMRNDKTLMAEFMKSVDAGGLGFEFENDQPVSWSSETFLTPEQMHDGLQTWWDERTPHGTVTAAGMIRYRTSDEMAFHFENRTGRLIYTISCGERSIRNL